MIARNSSLPEPAGTGQVDREAAARAVADLAGRAGAWVERALVDAGVEDVPGGGEDLLGPVAVVDVPVEDQDALGAARGDRVRRGDGDVVEQAEAHRARALGVMAGWPGPQNANAGLAGRAAIGRGGRAPGGMERAPR